jgi:HEAT repeat protein
VRRLIEELRKKERATRDVATWALRQIGDPAVEPLVDALRDATPGFKEILLQTARRLNPELMLEVLIASLKTDRGPGRATAGWALGKLGGTAVEALANTLDDKEPAVRQAVARALGATQDRRAVSPLLRALRDGTAGVREAAADALGVIGSRDGVPGLVAALKDEEARARAAAAEALGYVAPRRLSDVVTPPGGDQRAVDPLIAALKDQSPEVRRAAADALPSHAAHVGQNNPSLVELANDPSPEIRLAALRALGRMASHAYRDVLMRAFKDTDHRVRLAAVQAPIMRGYYSLIPIMKNTREHEDVRLVAIEPLLPKQHPRSGRTPAPPVEHFLEVWRDGTNPQQVRAAAWRAIQAYIRLTPLRAERRPAR